MLLKNLRPANDYDRFATETLEPWDLLFISRIRQLARGMTPGVIADIGTATGVAGAARDRPAMRGWRYVGIDLDPAMLDEGRPRIHALDLDDTIEMRVGDALALPFDDGTLTMAVGRATLHHLPDKALSLTEMYRVLELGGIALSTTCAAMRRSTCSTASPRCAPPPTIRRPTSRKKITLDEARALVAEAGLAEVASIYSPSAGLARSASRSC